MTSKDYHNKCDNQGGTIILMKNQKDNIFGGYAPISWNIEQNKYTKSSNSFLFSLTNIYNSEPVKFNIKNFEKALYYCTGYGPLFGQDGNDLGLYSDFMNEGGFSGSFNCTYSDTLGKGNSVFSGNQNSGNFKLKEIEVFKLL